MIKLDDIVAIDFHSHAEEPCCDQRDDGYNEFQAGMAKYFRNPAGAKGMLPTIEETAAYYRERRIACVIFPSTPSARPVSAATGTRRWPRLPLPIRTS